MDFKKFILENKKAITELAMKNAKYDINGNALLTKEELEEDTCWDEVYKEYIEKAVNHE